MKKLIAAAILVATGAAASPLITQTHYSCDGGHQVTVGISSIKIDGKSHGYVDSASGVGQHEDGSEYNISGAEYEGGWVFVRGDTAISGLLVHEENFWYCEAI